MKKILVLLSVACLLVCLVSCGKGYVNKYKAGIMNTHCWGDEASMEFSSFSGTYNFKLKGNNDSDHTLECEASLGEGEMNVYVGIDGEKELIFTIKGGESVDTTVTLDDKYDDTKTIYVIVESVSDCKNGDFEFDYN